MTNLAIVFQTQIGICNAYEEDDAEDDEQDGGGGGRSGPGVARFWYSVLIYALQTSI